MENSKSCPENLGLAHTSVKAEEQLLEYQNQLKAILETAYVTLKNTVGLKLDCVHKRDYLEQCLQDDEGIKADSPPS